MAIDITVVRYNGDRPGEDVLDPLLSEESAAIARGFGLLNERSVAHARAELSTPYVPGLRMGQIVEATDNTSGQSLVGRVTAIRIVGTKRTPDGSGEPFLGKTLTLECPTNFAGT